MDQLRPTDAPVVDRIILDLRAYEKQGVDHLHAETARADQAQARVDELTAELAQASDLAGEAAKRQVEALWEQARTEIIGERQRIRDREQQFLTALRTYLAEIEDAQQTLLDVARRAIDSGFPVDGASPAQERRLRVAPPSPAPASPPQRPPTMPDRAGAIDVPPPGRDGHPRFDEPAPQWAPPSGTPLAADRSAPATSAIAPSQVEPDGSPSSQRVIDMRNEQDLRRVLEPRISWRRATKLYGHAR